MRFAASYGDEHDAVGNESRRVANCQSSATCAMVGTKPFRTKKGEHISCSLCLHLDYVCAIWQRRLRYAL